ncbi:COG1361 S-layer family protein [Halopenitus sp. H-Gu1]|uniref:COG1361 S-layer family protein n=1 Tax=Halopenitus sp. H-Gu1 TaxID=3242697 RepID=UPI00359E9DC2
MGKMLRVGRVILVGVLVVSVLSMPVAAEYSVIGHPSIELSAHDNHVTAESQVVLPVSVSNDGSFDDGGPANLEQRVKTARNVQLTVLSGRIDAPITAKSGTALVGNVPEGGLQHPVNYKLDIGDAEPGTYRIPIRVEYDYTIHAKYRQMKNPPGYTDVEYTDRSKSEIKYVTVVVEDQPRFEIVDGEGNDLTAGDSGPLSFTLKNVGTQTATDARIQLRSADKTVQFGEYAAPQPTSSTFVSSLEPGESTAVEVQGVVPRDISPGEYPVTVGVEYEDPSGIEKRSKPLQFGVDVRPEQTFSIQEIRSDLNVGEDGTVTATIVNDGPADVTNALVTYRSESRTLTPTETEYAVGDLASGESSHFQFEFDVSEEADAGPRMPSFAVRYRNAEGEVRTSEPIDVPVTVDPEADPFQVEPVATTVTAGTQTTIELRVTNTRTETLTDIEAKLFADDPLTSDNDEAFVETLDPGESTTMKFDVGVAEGVIAKTYPVSVDFTYEDANDDTELSGTYRVPIDVVEPEDGGFPWSLIGGVGIASIGLVAWKRTTLWGLR